LGRFVALIAALAGTALLLTAGFPSGAPDRLPVFLASVGLAVLAAASPVRGIALFSLLFPCAGLLARMSGGHDPVAWPGVMLGGLVSGWCFRFLYDFESVPQPSRPDRVLRALVAVWTLSTVLAAARAVTLWAALRRLFGRVVNGEGLMDAAALRETLFAFAALAGGAVFYFVLRRSGPAARRAALAGSLAGVAVSAAFAILQRVGGVLPETRAYWRLTGRIGGGAVDPNSLGLLCALLLLVALARALDRSRPWHLASGLFLVRAGGLVLSGSRSAVLLAGLGCLLILFAKALPLRSRLFAIGALVLVAASAMVLSLAAGGSAGTRIVQTFDPALPVEYRASARPVLWSAAARLFLRHPIAGAGMGAFTWTLPDLLAEENRSFAMRDNPGSGYVQALAETGFLGLAVTLAAALSLAAQGWRRARGASAPAGYSAPSSVSAVSAGTLAAAGVSVIAFLAVLAVGSHWLAPDVALLFFLLAAVSGDTGTAVGGDSPEPTGSNANGRETTEGRLLGAAVILYAAATLVGIFETVDPRDTFRHGPLIGFHESEVGPGGPFRWTSRRFAVWLRTGENLRLGLANFGPLGKPVAIEARCGGVPVYRRILAPGQAVAVHLGAGRADGAVVFQLDRSFVPRRLGVSRDGRTLGLLSTLSAIGPER
jgi:O-antigen ligase